MFLLNKIKPKNSIQKYRHAQLFSNYASRLCLEKDHICLQSNSNQPALMDSSSADTFSPLLQCLGEIISHACHSECHRIFGKKYQRFMSKKWTFNDMLQPKCFLYLQEVLHQFSFILYSFITPKVVCYAEFPFPDVLCQNFHPNELYQSGNQQRCLPLFSLQFILHILKC